MAIRLKLRTISKADPQRGWVSSELYDIIADGVVVGEIQLRLGETDHIRLYGGHVGYRVAPEHRGHAHAAAALKALASIARTHDFGVLWITCRPDNTASQRTLEKVGAVYEGIVEVPVDSDLYARGDYQMKRYRLIL